MVSAHIRIFSSLSLLLAAVIWGFAFVVIKNSLDLIPPIYMLAFRFTIAAAALTLIMLPKLRRLTRRDWTSGAVLGFFLFTAHAVQTIGCQYTTAGKNAFLTTIYVIIAPICDGSFPVAAFQSEVVTSMLYLGLLSTMVSFLLKNVGQKYTAPSTASLLLSFESVFGVLFSIIFLQEHLTVRMLLGCGLMFFAVVLVETKFSFLTRLLSINRIK